MPGKVNILVPVLKMIGVRMAMAATSVAGASVPLRVCWTGCAPWSLSGGLVWPSVVPPAA